MNFEKGVSTIYKIIEKLHMNKRLAGSATILLECFHLATTSTQISVSPSEEEARAAACVYLACNLAHTRWTYLDIAEGTEFASCREIERRTKTIRKILQL